jgi:hypothetical protein
VGGAVKDANRIAELFEPLFEKYGRDITAIVTDSAAVMKAAGRILMDQYPWVTWLPCCTHQADLLMKKIAKLSYFHDIVTRIRGVCVWMRRHSVPLTTFKKLSPRLLLIPGETRFGSSVQCMERFLDRDVNNALKNVFSHDDYTTWLQKQAKTQRIKAGLAKKIVFDSSLRSKAKVLVKLLSPVMQVLRLFDRGMPVIIFVYYAVADMRDTSAKIMSDHKLPSQVQKVVLQIIDNQWESFATDMHAAAYLLNLRYWTYLAIC